MSIISQDTHYANYLQCGVVVKGISTVPPVRILHLTETVVCF